MSYRAFSQPGDGYGEPGGDGGGYLASSDAVAVKKPVVLALAPLPAACDVPNFLPSRNGFKFGNNFPAGPYLTIDVLGYKIPLGDARDGMCGGMAYAVRDLYEAGRLPPPITTHPASGSVAFSYLYQRLLQSFTPEAVWNYAKWMHPAFYNPANRKAGISWMTIQEATPALKECISRGFPCPLGLIYAQAVIDTWNIAELGKNHQVLAWGYKVEASTTTVKLYDPNYPGKDDVVIYFDHTKPEQPTVFTQTRRSGPVYGFFMTDYTWKDPRALF